MSKDVVKISMIVFAFCGILLLLFGNAHLSIMYNQHDFHIWQLVTAHFTHYGYQHLILNMVALIVMSCLVSLSFRIILIGMILAMALIDIYLLFTPITFYAGFSGLLYVIPGYSCAMFFFKKKYIYSITIVFLLVLYFQVSQPELHNTNGLIWFSTNTIHLIGFLSGFLAMFRAGFLHQPFSSKVTN